MQAGWLVGSMQAAVWGGQCCVFLLAMDDYQQLSILADDKEVSAENVGMCLRDEAGHHPHHAVYLLRVRDPA